jgi:hypothetical protein
MQSLIPSDKLESLKNDIETQKKKVESIVITDEESAQGASELLSVIKRKAKKIETMRLETTKPLRDQVKETNDFFKVYEEGFKAMETQLKSVVKQWLVLQQEIARKKQMEIEEAERKRRQEEEERRKAEEAEALKNNQPVPEPVVEKVEIVPVMEKPESKIRTESGLVGTRKVWKAEVVDQKLVPDNYKTVNLVEINKAVKMGVRMIPGVKIYQDINISVR